MTLQDGFRNPKRGFSLNHNNPDWYDYYAGYSPDFVQGVLTYLNLRTDAIVMDPWNGSGTTTQVAQDMGFSAIGFDINPAMVIVANARRLDPSVRGSLPSLCRDILKKASRYRAEAFLEREPLETWLVSDSAAMFRDIERAIRQLLIQDCRYHHPHTENELTDMSSLAAFFYTALFRTLRHSLAPFRSSNPTWIKTPLSPNHRLLLNADGIHEMFENHVLRMTKILDSRVRSTIIGRLSEPQIRVSSSVSLPLPDGSVHAVISSPPYCTRIDYAIATKPELALLGYSMDVDITGLRRRMIGTPTISETVPQVHPDWGPTCTGFLTAVESHVSKGSRSYYFKNYLQYFDAIYLSLEEIDRVLAENGHCIIVVQDSYYKELHNDLPLVFSEMGRSFGWSLHRREDFTMLHTMVGINRKTKRYRHSTEAIESVLMFQKTS